MEKKMEKELFFGQMVINKVVLLKMIENIGRELTHTFRGKFILENLVKEQ